MTVAETASPVKRRAQMVVMVASWFWFLSYLLVV
jgi:hypothetical protein